MKKHLNYIGDYYNIMETSQITYQVNLSQLTLKIYDELVENNLIHGQEANILHMDANIIKIAILTLYQIAVLNKDYEDIKFDLNDLTGITEIKTVLNTDLMTNEK